MNKSVFSAYLNLTKPTIVLLFVVTGLAAIVVEGSLLNQPLKLTLIMFAMACTAGSANALNMFFDRDIDSLMDRTKRRRPIPLHQVTPTKAAIFGAALGVFAILYYGFVINWLTAGLSFFTIAFYVGIYTLILKRNTPYNIVIGGAAGAMAPLMGWAAATGHLSVFAWVLFGIIFLWTPPHFWALAIAIQEDYRAAKIPMLPVTHGDERTRLEIFLYTIFLLPLTVVPQFLGLTTKFYLVNSILLGAGYLFATVVFLRRKTKEDSKKLFWVSILYLFFLFFALLADHWFI